MRKMGFVVCYRAVTCLPFLGDQDPVLMLFRKITLDTAMGQLYSHLRESEFFLRS
jgi:hypothetical protein